LAGRRSRRFSSPADKSGVRRALNLSHGRVIYSVASSLDGYHTDIQGDYSWAVPDEEVIAALNADAADVSTYLYGRRMYEAMAEWETDPAVAAQSPESAAYDLSRRQPDVNKILP
jgi:dihydrofolate reductase